MSFNPYFTGYTTFTYSKRNTRYYRENVSILVLMDILLLHYNQTTVSLSFKEGFNPCFNGYTTFTPN